MIFALLFMSKVIFYAENEEFFDEAQRQMENDPDLTWNYVGKQDPNPNVKEIVIDGNEFNEMTERVSDEKLKSGADSAPPLMELINTAVVVSIHTILCVP